MGTCYSLGGRNTQRVASTGSMPHPITQSNTSLASQDTSSQVPAQDAQNLGFTKPYGGRYVPKAGHHSNQQSAGRGGKSSDRMTLGTVVDPTVKAMPHSTTGPYQKPKSNRFGFKPPSSKLKTPAKSCVSKSTDSLSSAGSVGRSVKKTESSGSLTEKVKGIRIHHSAYTPKEQDSWKMIDDESRSTSIKSADNASRTANEKLKDDDIKNANIDADTKSAHTITSEQTLHASTNSVVQNLPTRPVTGAKSAAPSRISYNSSKLPGPGTGRYSAKPRGPLAKFAHEHYGSCNERGWVKASSAETEPCPAHAAALSNIDNNVPEATSVAQIMSQKPAKVNIAECTNSTDEVESKPQSPSEMPIEAVTKDTEHKSSDKRDKESKANGTKKESSFKKGLMKPSFLKRGLLRKQKSSPEEPAKSSRNEKDKDNGVTADGTGAQDEVDFPQEVVEKEVRESTEKSLCTTLESKETNDDVFVKEQVNIKRAENGFLAAMAPAVAPLAMVESIETTSQGSLGSDDLMLEWDMELPEECDYEDQKGFPKPRSRSNSGRFKARSRSRSQSGDDLDDPDKKALQLLRRHPEGGAVQRQDSGKRNSLGKRGSGLQEEALDELAHLMDDNAVVRRNSSLSRAIRPCSFPGPRHRGVSFENDDPSLASSPGGSVVLRPPRQTPSVGDDELVSMDGFTYRQLMQDITMYKTMLLKLKRVIQDDEIGTPWKNGLLFGGSLPTSPCCEEGHKPCIGESPTDPNKLQEILKENQELKEQVQVLTHRTEEHERTIKLLQHQMMHQNGRRLPNGKVLNGTKYECGHLGPGGKVFTNASVQTDKPLKQRLTHLDSPRGASGPQPLSGRKSVATPSDSAPRARTELRTSHTPDGSKLKKQTINKREKSPDVASPFTGHVTHKSANQKVPATKDGWNKIVTGRKQTNTNTKLEEQVDDCKPSEDNLNSTFILPSDANIMDSSVVSMETSTVSMDTSIVSMSSSTASVEPAKEDNLNMTFTKIDSEELDDTENDNMSSTTECDNESKTKIIRRQSSADSNANPDLALSKKETQSSDNIKEIPRPRQLPQPRKIPKPAKTASALQKATPQSVSKLPGLRIQKYTRTEASQLKSFSGLAKKS